VCSTYCGRREMMGPIEALNVALAREQASIELYNKLYLRHPEIKELFLLLVNEEEKHKQLIEKRIVEIRTK
jgi:rubrerythrin